MQTATNSYTAAPQIIKVWGLDFFGLRQRKAFEAKNPDLVVVCTEEVKQWDQGRACCLALIFLPLIFIKTKRVKVTYQYAGSNK